MTDKSTNITLLVEGMDCTACALGITKSLQKKGAENVHVDFATGEAAFFIDDKKQLPVMVKSITDLGYKVVDSNYLEANKGKLTSIEKRFYFTLPFTVVLFFGHMLFSHDFILNNAYVQLALCLPVFIIGIMQFGKSAWGSVKAGVPNMDVLVFIGSTAAFIYSIVGMLMYQAHDVHNYLFFETTASIITLVLLGNVIEHRSVKQTTTAIQELSAIQPTTAKMLSLQFGKEVFTEVDYKNIHIGAILQVNMGDKVPVDGEVISGNASIDEAMLTGESLPVEKQMGSKVIGGTILLSGSIRMRAETVGDNTLLSKIIELVKKAQQDKPNIQKLGDRISAIFVPVVLLISVITFCVNYFFVSFAPELSPLQESIMRSIAVLVISCPCAMGLATPTAVMVGIGRAAKMGILIKGGSTLEEFAKIKNIVFDKTGTLTNGVFKIKNIQTFGDFAETEVKEVLLVLEQHSSHPIAKSIVEELKSISITKKYTSIVEEKGLGIHAVDEANNSYKIGSYRYAEQLTKDSNHNLYVIKNEQLIAVIDLQDTIKENVETVIQGLKQQAIEPILLSGDSVAKCNEVAQKVGITKVYSQQLPNQKLEIIEQLNKNGSTAMVGDGINDAPALAKATVGISLSNATQAAIQSAQIILLKNNDLSSLTQAHLISKHTLITIKQNLFWAFFYNVVAIPIAAAGMLSPMVGALSMAFSDVIVIGNSIRLKTKKLV